MTRLFGTDGVRGLANRTLTADLALRLGASAAAVLAAETAASGAGTGEGSTGSGRPLAVVGRDPRVSGEMLEAALAAGLSSQGVDVLLEMSGSAAAVDQGFAALAYGGEAALLGLLPQPLLFDVTNHIIVKGATVHGVIGRRLWGTWYEMRTLLTSGRLNLAPLITHRFH